MPAPAKSPDAGEGRASEPVAEARTGRRLPTTLHYAGNRMREARERIHVRRDVIKWLAPCAGGRLDSPTRASLTYLCMVHMLLCMRTTMDLDSQLYRQAKLFAAEHQLTLTSVMEDGLRALFQQKQALKTPKPFKLVVFKGGGPAPGVDLSDNSALADLMDSERDAPSRR